MKWVQEFIDQHVDRHPELRRQVHWSDVRRMAEREGLAIRRLPLSRLGRLIRFKETWEIQISDELDESSRAVVGMHELVHYWRDRMDEPAMYASQEWEDDPAEDFANAVAWYLTSPTRPLMDPPADHSL